MTVIIDSHFFLFGVPL